jgi:hypothetical protein
MRLRWRRWGRGIRSVGTSVKNLVDCLRSGARHSDLEAAG